MTIDKFLDGPTVGHAKKAACEDCRQALFLNLKYGNRAEANRIAKKYLDFKHSRV